MNTGLTQPCNTYVHDAQRLKFELLQQQNQYGVFFGLIQWHNTFFYTGQFSTSTPKWCIVGLTAGIYGIRFNTFYLYYLLSIYYIYIPSFSKEPMIAYTSLSSFLVLTTTLLRQGRQRENDGQSNPVNGLAVVVIWAEVRWVHQSRFPQYALSVGNWTHRNHQLFKWLRTVATDISHQECDFVSRKNREGCHGQCISKSHRSQRGLIVSLILTKCSHWNGGDQR